MIGASRPANSRASSPEPARVAAGHTHPTLAPSAVRLRTGQQAPVIPTGRDLRAGPHMPDQSPRGDSDSTPGPEFTPPPARQRPYPHAPNGRAGDR